MIKSKMMQARNRYNNKEDEVVIGEYKKNFGGCLLNLLFGVGSLKYFAFLIVCGIILLPDYLIKKHIDTTSLWFKYLAGFMCVIAFFWLCRIIIRIVEFRYTKYLIITNQGIWFMNTGRFWSYKDWAGRRTFLGPHWNIYSWDELNNIEVFTDRIARMCKLKNIKLYRWDGSCKLYYFSAREVDDILAYSREQYKPKKIKRVNNKNLPSQIRFIKSIERFFSGDNDEE